MSDVVKFKKGLDIKMKGVAEKVFVKAGLSERYALKPTDFRGLTPKLVVKPDDLVKAGTTLFYDKYHPEIKFSSPVSGKIQEIRRGERRKILEVIVEPDGKMEYEQFGAQNVSELTREQIIAKLLESGAWPFVRQRPYGTIANPSDHPRDIFISAFDTSPLAPDNDFVMTGQEEDFLNGMNALMKLTTGEVHIGTDADYPASSVYNKTVKARVHKFKGKHPAGNVGVQIHHIKPINKGEIVWYLYPQDVSLIGRLFRTGNFDFSRIVALTGSEVHKPRYYKMIGGAAIKPLLIDNIKDGEKRIISGNVLTGTSVSTAGFIGFYDTQLTIVPEGNYYELFGWALPGFNKYSASRTFFSWLTPNRKYQFDTNLHGGERAFVVTGQYEKVLPMDIFPVQLLKSILAGDIERMENLGIYEIIEEDLALCEFVCTSKIEVQSIVSKGIDLMIKELG